ncbi:hypothetical protein B5K08_13425 [Rhizobium leguminosarum bv. trifolii]|nr:hypothetical protein B5K08_13425 [Rhizobium leguminosarum bv. trifolii]
MYYESSGFPGKESERTCSLPVSIAYRWTNCPRPQPTPSIRNTELITMDDVIIIGGSFAGLAAALQLGLV